MLFVIYPCIMDVSASCKEWCVRGGSWQWASFMHGETVWRWGCIVYSALDTELINVNALNKYADNY